MYRVLLNPLRIWLEDRRAPKYDYIGQMKAWCNTNVEHRTERPRPAGQIMVVRRHDHGAAAHHRPVDGLPALRVWQTPRRALSRLLAIRRRCRVAANLVALQARATRRRQA